MKTALSRLDGVIEVDVDFDAKLAFVVYDPAKTTPVKVAEGLAQATRGKYKAMVKS